MYNIDKMISIKLKNKTIRNRVIIVMLLVLLNFIFVLNVGYAKSNDLSTANTNKQFDIQFENAKIIKSVGVEEDTYSINTSNDNKEIIINAGNLKYPGAKVYYSVDIINKGDIQAKLEKLYVKGLENSKVIKVKGLEKIENTTITLEKNEKYTICFWVEWDENSNESLDEKVSFEIKMNYVQAI